MTGDHTKSPRRWRPALLAAGAILLLSGCAATHVGEDWQCAMAQGVPCTRVAVADPAVQGTDPAVRGAGLAVRGADQAVERAKDNVRSAEPQWLSPARNTQDQSTPTKSGAGDRAGQCKGFAGCNPFAFLARLLPGGSADGGNAAASPADSGPEGGDPGDEEAQGAIAPDAPAPNAELRAPERIGRVWIAPYVDADGVYHEASWVRVVIAPARWKR